MTVAPEVPLMGMWIEGRLVKFVDQRTYERVFAEVAGMYSELEKFARAHGLTDEMFDEWRALKPPMISDPTVGRL